jgi:hypothetical protein
MMKRMNPDQFERVRLIGAQGTLHDWIGQSLAELDANLRTAEGVELYRLQGSAQTLAEILHVLTQSRE